LAFLSRAGIGLFLPWRNFLPHIVVLGSLNMDLVMRVANLPRAGETLRG